ncbi:MAG: PAS domain-containing protein, partial [Verrucomicrobiae bacterium]|nr:PAS domain-containing protein [Verrucomicrobiae bacterium]
MQQIPGFGVFWKDKNSIYLGCNESFARIAGARNPAAIVGKNDFELGCSREEAEEFRRVDREVIRTGKTVLNMREVAHGRKRATHLRTHKTPLRDGRGKIIGVLGITEDITNSAEMEGALRQKERELEALLNHLPDLAWLKDTQSRFILVNESFAEKCGRRPESLKGKTDLDVWPRKLAEGYRAADRQVIREGKTLRMEEELETTDKSRTWIETIKAPIRDGRGKIVGTVGIARDITEQKRWAERQ